MLRPHSQQVTTVSTYEAMHNIAFLHKCIQFPDSIFANAPIDLLHLLGLLLGIQQPAIMAMKGEKGHV
jgi:hypothetical protein